MWRAESQEARLSISPMRVIRDGRDGCGGHAGRTSPIIITPSLSLPSSPLSSPPSKRQRGASPAAGAAPDVGVSAAAAPVADVGVSAAAAARFDAFLKKNKPAHIERCFKKDKIDHKQAKDLFASLQSRALRGTAHNKKFSSCTFYNTWRLAHIAALSGALAAAARSAARDVAVAAADAAAARSAARDVAVAAADAAAERPDADAAATTKARFST